MAKTKQQINPNEKMNNEDKKEVKGWIDKLEEKLNKFFERKEAKALALTLEDGRGVTISGETEQAETGQEVTLTEGGEKLPDGTYKLSNGQTITVADGVITAVTSEESEANKETEEMKALQDKLTALETENATLKTAKTEAEAKAQKVETEAKAQAEEMKALKTDFDGFKSKLETSGFIPRDENNKREEGKASATTGREAALERRLTKNKK
jgi:regulator of protease activity HflC (stomatin/prohibitin superfamily)